MQWQVCCKQGTRKQGHEPHTRRQTTCWLELPVQPCLLVPCFLHTRHCTEHGGRASWPYTTRGMCGCGLQHACHACQTGPRLVRPGLLRFDLICFYCLLQPCFDSLALPTSPPCTTPCNCSAMLLLLLHKHASKQRSRLWAPIVDARLSGRVRCK